MTFTMRVVVTTLTALTVWLWSGPVAAAHTSLISSDPAKDSQSSTPPSAVVLTFSEDINPQFATAVVNSVDGHNWAAAQARVEGPRLTADIGPQPLPDGRYTVGYRVVSADGHPVSGSYSFTVVSAPGPSPASAPTAPATTAAPPAAVQPTGSGIPRPILYAGIAGLAVGGAIAFWQSRKRGRDDGGKPDD
ncbi:copper resistance protein CopC [Mycolicibacterium rhodesiae JS60]|nr:copper resistance protein CopC [Mycolicibacterium rhodesiae JS60]